MLSRVASVMEPRTHNRRRVTGSSRRRREGRESERQRPNMSRHLFCSEVLLLLVMMCCNTGGAASTEKKLTDSELPKRKLFGWRDTTDGGTVIFLSFPSLVEVNGDVFAVAEAECKEGNEKFFTGIASELLALTGDQTRKELDKNKLKTQVLEECPSDDEKCATQAVYDSVSESGAPVHVSKPTTVVHGSDIYMLAGMYDRAVAIAAEEDITDEWGLLLARGNVTGKDNEKRICWNDIDAIPITSNTEQHEYVTAMLGSGGSGVKMEDGTLVFPMEGEEYRTVEEDEENTAGGGYSVSLFIYSPDNKSGKLSKGMSEGGCSDPSVVEWEKDKLMMMTACDDGRRRVYESGDKGDSWTEALGTLSRVWFNKNEGNEKGVRSGFIKATLGGDGEMRKVMLVTLPVYSKEKENGKGVLHLWLTDNTHIVEIGPVSGKDEDVTASFLLYKSGGNGDNNNEKELIALYEKGNGETPSHDMVTARLTEQLEKVKEVLKMWKKVDERVSQLCTNLLARKITSTGTACNTVIPTDGLVGFLSDNFSGTTWRDEYLGVNATVNNDGGAKKADNGVQFTGRSAGAQWPVGSQGENQLYHFANYNFTLAATVSIDGEPTEGNIPLLGVKRDGDGNHILLGLSYNKEKKWILLCGGGQKKEHSRDWDPETTKKDHVVILLRNGNHRSAYVDGERVGDAQCALKNADSKEISHFYIGGDGDKTRSREGVSVTVRNVLLYNRPLSSEEIGAFNPNKAPTTPQMNSLTQGTSNERSGGRQEEQESLEVRGAGGASTTVVSTVTTSSAEEESVIQVTSGTSSGGTKTMAAASSPDGNTAAETEARKTVQGDGSPQTPVDNPDAAAKKAPNAEAVGQDGPPVNPEVGASSGENGEPTEETDGQEEEVQSQERELNAAALNSSLGNVSQGNNTDSGTVSESRMLPSLLLLLLGLWGFAAL
ncbi:trans-sialidase [Trypanosoma cruzi cruzi]|uniref:Putative trans-sialidase, Group VI n=1 Tax=Trypanosoma cruzi TaxID=5693 RepID=A0A2V2US76_TRYCR|nr:trans-sialidase [Trypanosoma cruzi cruzi]PWU86910.1 putative trans-sialidase, Group VI [Trypanosoma cruzi]